MKWNFSKSDGCMVIFLKCLYIQFWSFNMFQIFFCLMAILKNPKIASKRKLNYLLTRYMQPLWNTLLSRTQCLLLLLIFHFYYFKNIQFEYKSIQCFYLIYILKEGYHQRFQKVIVFLKDYISLFLNTNLNITH